MLILNGKQIVKNNSILSSVGPLSVCIENRLYLVCDTFGLLFHRILISTISRFFFFFVLTVHCVSDMLRVIHSKGFRVYSFLACLSILIMTPLTHTSRLHRRRSPGIRSETEFKLHNMMSANNNNNNSNNNVKQTSD